MQIKELLKRKLFFRLLSLLFAGTSIVLLFLFLGLMRENKAYKKLVQADQLFIDQLHDDAFEKYGNIPSWLTGDTLIESRKTSLSQNTGYLAKFICSSESFYQLLEALETCDLQIPQQQTSESLDSLIQLAILCMQDKRELILTKKESLADFSKQTLLTIHREKGDIVYYLGEISIDSAAQGYGIGIHSNGNYYKGDWKNNMRHGFGTLQFKNGDIYQGDFAFDKREGEGTIWFRNKDYYSGQWSDNRRDGWGTVFSKNGDTIVDGFWERDRHNRRVTREKK
jgi:hypothetical protein